MKGREFHLKDSPKLGLSPQMFQRSFEYGISRLQVLQKKLFLFCTFSNSKIRFTMTQKQQLHEWVDWWLKVSDIVTLGSDCVKGQICETIWLISWMRNCTLPVDNNGFHLSHANIKWIFCSEHDVKIVFWYLPSKCWTDVRKSFHTEVSISWTKLAFNWVFNTQVSFMSQTVDQW